MRSSNFVPAYRFALGTIPIGIAASVRAATAKRNASVDSEFVAQSVWINNEQMVAPLFGHGSECGARRTILRPVSQRYPSSGASYQAGIGMFSEGGKLRTSRFANCSSAISMCRRSDSIIRGDIA
jgi:hypothetical protein